MKQERLFRGLFLVNFAITLGFGITDAFFSTYLFSLGGRGMLLALPLLLYSLSKIIFSPLMGACSDRFGAKTMVMLSLTLYLLVSLSYFFSSSLALITVLRLVQGLGCAMFKPVMLSLVGAASRNDGRAGSMGTFDVSFYGALGLGPVLGGVVKDAWGFGGIFATLVLLCLFALGVAQQCIRGSEGAITPPDAGRCRAPLSELLTAARYGVMRGLLVFIFGRGCGISLLGAFLPIMLSTKLGLNGTQTGLVLASMTLVITCLLRPVGRLSDRVCRESLVVIGGTTVSLLYFLIPVAQGFCQVLVLGGGIGLFSVLSLPASTALLLEQGERYGTGLAVGVFNAALNLGLVAGPLLGAWFHYNFGLTSVFYAAGVLGLAAVGLFSASMGLPLPLLLSPRSEPGR